MKKIIIILACLTLASCGGGIKDTFNTENMKSKMKNLGKNPCFDKEKNQLVLFCK